MKRNRIKISPFPGSLFARSLQRERRRRRGVGGGSPPLLSPSLTETYSFLELSSAQRRIYTSFENVSFIAVLQFATLPAQGRNNFSRRLRGERRGGRKKRRTVRNCVSTTARHRRRLFYSLAQGPRFNRGTRLFVWLLERGRIVQQDCLPRPCLARVDDKLSYKLSRDGDEDALRWEAVG